MKKVFLNGLVIAALAVTAAVVTSCKSKGGGEAGNVSAETENVETAAAGIMTMTTAERSSVWLYLAGSGTVTIDWGDQTVETYELKPFDDDDDFGENSEYRFRHEYADKAVRKITITGGVTAMHVDLSLTALDVSQNTALRTLSCWRNSLTELDVSRNTELVVLYCGGNKLTSLNVSGANALKMLYCDGNSLTALDVSTNTALEILSCDNNQLTALDVSRNVTLTELHCDNNQLTVLDVSRNASLTKLSVENNQFTAAALNALFETLHAQEHTAGKTIFIGSNPGSADCDPTIARTKGWKVSGFAGGQEHLTDDITVLMRQEATFLGMIGNEGRKMGIAFLTVVRTDDNLYEVTGKSKVGVNICDFRGTIEVQSAGVDILSTYEGVDYYIGKITGKYLFEEDRNQASAGAFEGTFEIVWNNENLPAYLTSIEHEHIEFNVGATFTGTWKSYSTEATLKACWGNLRECKPCCINDGQELWISERYRSRGWALEIDWDKYISENWNFDEATEKIKTHPEYLEWFEWWK